MPNCDYYALPEDHASVIRYILAETPCQIWESYSRPGYEIRMFSRVEDILSELDQAPGLLVLSLYSETMQGEFRIHRIRLRKDLDRYNVKGWGLIQFHLGKVNAGRLERSHTNHNSERRATVWAETIKDMGSPKMWDWKEVTRLSRRINSYIRKNCVDKVGSLSVLPLAAEWSRQGGVLAPR